jgi:hypothetical protein
VSAKLRTVASGIDVRVNEIMKVENNYHQ